MRYWPRFSTKIIIIHHSLLHVICHFQTTPPSNSTFSTLIFKASERGRTCPVRWFDVCRVLCIWLGVADVRISTCPNIIYRHLVLMVIIGCLGNGPLPSSSKQTNCGLLHNLLCPIFCPVYTVSKIVSAGPRGEPAPVRQVFCRVFTPSFKYKN